MTPSLANSKDLASRSPRICVLPRKGGDRCATAALCVNRLGLPLGSPPTVYILCTIVLFEKR